MTLFAGLLVGGIMGILCLFAYLFQNNPAVGLPLAVATILFIVGGLAFAADMTKEDNDRAKKARKR